MSAIASEHILKKAAQSFPQAVAYATATMCFSIFSVGTLFGYNMSQSFSVLSQPDVVRDQTPATFRGEYQQARKHHPKLLIPITSINGTIANFQEGHFKSKAVIPADDTTQRILVVRKSASIPASESR